MISYKTSKLWSSVMGICFAAIAVLPLCGQQTAGDVDQSVNIKSIRWGYYRPGDVVAARMHAHADQMRSFGYGAAKYGEFLVDRENAISMRLDNKLQRLKYYFEAKRINRAYREETRPDVREKLVISNSKMWRDIKSLPELANKTNGKAQNFLLHRLSSTVLAFQYAKEKDKLNDELMAYLRIEPGIYDHLWLKQGATKFAASGGEALDVSWWPYVLRDTRFDEPREHFVNVRNQIADGSGIEIPFSELQNLATAHQDLATALNDVYRSEQTQRKMKSKTRISTDQRIEWRRGFQYLDGLYLEIRRLKQSGRRELLTGQMRFDAYGNDATFISFLNFMLRNGLEFAPAAKGPESVAAYNTVFHLMRDLYVLAADDDAAVMPKSK